jgi:YcxB-like protein
MKATPMRVEYQLTYDDWLEASRVVTRIRMWVVTLLLAGLAVGFTLLPIATENSTAGNLISLLFWVGVFAYIWVLIFVALRGAARKPWRKGPHSIKPILPSWLRRFIIPASAIVFVVWAMAVRAKHDVAANGSIAAQGAMVPSSFATGLATILTLLPLTIYPLLASVFAMISSKGGILGWPYLPRWKSQHQLRRPMVAEFTETSCLISEPLSQHQYSWEYFPGWVETQTLFILFVSNLNVIVLPKRAFTEPQRAEFVQLAGPRISESFSAFPVMPAASQISPPTGPPVTAT